MVANMPHYKQYADLNFQNLVLYTMYMYTIICLYTLIVVLTYRAATNSSVLV